MKSITNKIFILNVLLLIIWVIADKFWSSWGFNDAYYFFFMLVIFALAMMGLGTAIVEYKNNTYNPLIGFIGNLLIVIFFFIFLLIAISKVSKNLQHL
jgi:hypothetical protein